MSIPVINIEAMREWEKATWDAGISEKEVIDRVGRSIANWVQVRFKKGNILIIVGRGNNGEDGRAAARHLAFETRILEVTDPLKARRAFLKTLEKGPHFDMILDCIFGIGLNRSLSDNWCDLISEINRSSVKIISVDVPSGLNAETGKTMGEAIRAETTLCVGAPKLGMIQFSASEYVGYIRVLNDVGLVDFPMSSQNIYFGESADFASFSPLRKASDSKSDLGYLEIWAGSEGYHGAAILAARAAMRTRPGRISMQTFSEVYLPIASQLQQVMVQIWKPNSNFPISNSSNSNSNSDSSDSISDSSISESSNSNSSNSNSESSESSNFSKSSKCNYGKTAFLVGPGLAARSVKRFMGEALHHLWCQANCPVIADASALDLIPKGEIKTKATRVITPHSGEAARLLGCDSSDIERRRIESLRALSHTYGGAWVILKGTHTLIGRSEGRVFVNATGDPGLAQGGSGDVLSGMIAGLLANPRLHQNVEQSLQFAVWKHGLAAENLSRTSPNWIVENLPDAMFLNSEI